MDLHRGGRSQRGSAGLHLRLIMVANYTAIIIANTLVAALGALASFAIHEPRLSEPPSLTAQALSASAGR